MTTAAVLHAAADTLERQETHRTDRDLRNGAGGHIFGLLFETAKQLYGWPAICHLQQHLGIPQIQHWQEADRGAVVKALRDAADQPVSSDIETAALRAKLADFHTALADAMGWLTYDVTTLVAEVGNEMSQLRRDNERLAAELAEARTARTGPAQTVPAQTNR